MKKQLILSLAFLASFAAQAAGTATGVVSFETQTGSIVVYTSAGTASNTPSCASANPGRFAIDISTAVGQSYQRQISRANALGKTVTMTGSGACSMTGSIETLDTLSGDPR